MRVQWDKVGEHFYEVGVDRAMLYLEEDPTSPTFDMNTRNRAQMRNTANGYSFGVPWNGLTAVNENPTGGESTKHYADNMPYLTLVSVEDLGFTIEAFTYPPEFSFCQGRRNVVNGVSVGQQARKPFGFAYRTKIGNDTQSDSYGYKLHLYYNCQASPSSRNNTTINDNPEPTSMSWDATTTPVNIPGMQPSASIEIDSTMIAPDLLKKIEDILYGTDGADGSREGGTSPRLPMPEELFQILQSDETAVMTRAKAATH